MKFATTVIAASAAALVSASPIGTEPTEIKTGDVFRIMTIRSGSDLQYGQLQAANNFFLVNTPKQNAFCSEDVNYASFWLSEAGELYLNTPNPPQIAWVDRSGMGQGAFGYTTGAQGGPRYSERTGFTLDENNNLIFKDKSNQKIGFQACPSPRVGGYSVWLDSVHNAGGNQNCTDFTARALKEDTPVSCTYTQQ